MNLGPLIKHVSQNVGMLGPKARELRECGMKCDAVA